VVGLGVVATEGEFCLNDRAGAVLMTAQALAISSYSRIAKNFRSVSALSVRHWNYVLTIGGVFVAVSQLNHEPLSEHTRNALLDIVTETVATWDPRGIEAVEDCRLFVDRTYDGLMTLPERKANPQFVFSDSLGGWITWNLFDHAPSDPEERQLVRVLGGLLVNAFVSWWKTA
jgi:hypothetical protein